MGEAAANVLQGKRIVVTRAAEQSEYLLEALRDRGAIPVLLPLVSFAPPDDLKRLDEIVQDLRQFDWIFLTSQNALRALQEASVRVNVPLNNAIDRVAIAAVGPATADAARDAGVDVGYVASKHDGVSLAQELATRVKGKRVLLPRSDRANQDLVTTLEELGANVTEVVAYKTIRPADAEDRLQETMLCVPPDAVLFFSPSAVHHLEELLGADAFRQLGRAAAFLAIGPVTERALRRGGAERIVKAEDTTVESVLRGLTYYFAGAAAASPAGVKRG